LRRRSSPRAGPTTPVAAQRAEELAAAKKAKEKAETPQRVVKHGASDITGEDHVQQGAAIAYGAIPNVLQVPSRENLERFEAAGAGARRERCAAHRIAEPIYRKFVRGGVDPQSGRQRSYYPSTVTKRVVVYDNDMLVEFIPEGARVRMVVEIEPHRDEHWTRMSAQGFESQLTKAPAALAARRSCGRCRSPPPRTIRSSSRCEQRV
jgi:hypothetical protein